MLKYVDKAVLRLIVRLTIFCVLFTLGFSFYLERKLEALEAGAQSVQQTAAAMQAPELSLPPETQVEKSGLARWEEELLAADKQTETLLLRRADSNSSVKQIYESIELLWNGKMKQLVSTITEQMGYEEARAFQTEQSAFIRERNESAMAAIGNSRTAVSESIDYTRVMGELTRERCYSLLENYSANLDN